MCLSIQLFAPAASRLRRAWTILSCANNSRSPALSPNIVKWVREAWIFGSLQCGDTVVRSGYLMAALLCDDTLAALARDSSSQFARINSETLRTSVAKITAGSSEAGRVAEPAGG